MHFQSIVGDDQTIFNKKKSSSFNTLTTSCYNFKISCGNQILSIALAYRIGESTVRNVIKETCALIIKVLARLYLKAPTEQQWLEICQEFWRNFNFPNCCRAVDGKHIQIQAPPNSGSLYYNYKKTFSIVLLAACDNNYKFTLVDFGVYGSNNDADIFARSEFGKALQNSTLFTTRKSQIACKQYNNTMLFCWR